MSRSVKLALALAGLVAVGVVAMLRYRAEEPPPPAPAPAVASVAPAAPAPPAGQTRWLAIGGGAGPDSNQLSLERDVALAAEVLGPSGRILFAGGPGSSGVQVTAERDGDRLLAELAALFAPRAGRDARYRRTSLTAEGPATHRRVAAELEQLLGAGGRPLLVYFAVHGDVGSTPSDNAVALWGGSALSVAELASLTEQAGRPLRLVVAACFSGGFTELAFRDADARKGATSADRCALSSSTWDLEASGCDPDPDRRNHEGYAIHFWNALRGRDRHGGRLGRAHIDFDGDGGISLLEAHSRVRIASRGIEVPTTTSERWLRDAAPERGPSAAVDLPEEDAVVAGLGSRLGLEGRADEGRADEARAALDRFDAKLAALEDDEEAARAEEQESFQAIAGELLARWPVLDDPWHPDFASTLARDRDAIRSHLERSDAYRLFTQASAALDRLSAEMHGLMAERAPYERLERALDTRVLAARLKARGGEPWKRFEKLRTCERETPLSRR